MGWGGKRGPGAGDSDSDPDKTAEKMMRLIAAMEAVDGVLGAKKKAVNAEADETLYGLRQVHVATGAIEGVAIGMYEFPHQAVLDMMTAPTPPAQMERVIKMFKLAIDPEKLGIVEVLTFRELQEVVEQWIQLSTMLAGGEEGFNV